MSKKHFIWRVAVIAAALISAASLSACGAGKPVKSNIPEISQNVEKTQQSAQPTAAPVEQSSDNTPQSGSTGQSGIVGDDANGYMYLNDDGSVAEGYCDGIEVDGVAWNIIEGKATKVETESDEVLHRALQMVAKNTTADMSREEKLRACFDHIKEDYLEGVRHDPPYQEIDWPILYANDIFVYGKGDCFSYGAAFAYIGKAIGFSECYACNSGGHGWAHIDGKYYDPEWDMHHNEYNHFGVSPGDDCDVDYVDSLTEGVDWMHVKV